MTCFHYKHHGEIEVTSQCSDRVRMTRGKGRSSICPAHFNTQLIITEATNAHDNCGTIKLKVPGKYYIIYETTLPAQQSKNAVSTNVKHRRYVHFISNFLSIHFHTKRFYVPYIYLI